MGYSSWVHAMRPCLARLSSVTHIGTLDPSHKGVRGPSQEGMGVSFSKHPEDWERIAKLGGQPWWQANLSSLNILDGHRFIKKHLPELLAWGEAQGLSTPTTAYQVSWYDDELEDTVCFLAPTRAAAEAEVDYMDEEDYDIKEIASHAPTRRLVEAMGAPDSDVGKPSLSIDQDLATLWARSQDLDGVWWNDVHDPAALSAPRGVIFPDRLDRVTFSPVSSVAPRRPRPR